jgi:hypothetical protein
MDTFVHPFVVLVVALATQGLAVWVGALLSKLRPLQEEERSDFDIIRTAALTLLGLIIGFTFAMAITRYDQRKNLEEAEANAIGTEYARADLLPSEGAAKVRELLRKYVDLRIAFYRARSGTELDQINADTGKLQDELWSAVVRAVTPQRSAVEALAVSGMNDVLNSQGYTQAAWWNRIPVAAWALMGIIAIACNLLFGYGARRSGYTSIVLPIIVSTAFLLIADIDSPRAGIIRVSQEDLVAVSRTARPMQMR